ncbi:hypothetical protein [Pantoea rwandensis]|uniref:Uncharacterized protein n=1 Tax=Pantoea rwandensis TaxID=1076550 RepID=A0A1X1CNV9_9GAMM|nr:hypothetical protein [Pantoea rwandensis]ORM66098.1 hypothetical protein HA51_23950 [Pantoea rwandensis]
MSNEGNIANSLAVAISKHCAAFEESDEFNSMVKEHVKSLYEKAIKDTFKWGKFPDSVQKALESALPSNISEMVDLPRYNLLLAREMAEQWEANAISENLVTQMQSLVYQFVKEDQTPKYIKASVLWSAYCEQYQDEAAEDGWERPEVVIEDDRDGFFYIGFEKEEPSSSLSRFSVSKAKDRAYQCETYLGFYRKSERDENRKSSHAEHDGFPVYSLHNGKLEYSDVLGKKPVQFRTKFEKLVGALYYGGSFLLLDSTDADDIYYEKER